MLFGLFRSRKKAVRQTPPASVFDDFTRGVPGQKTATTADEIFTSEADLLGDPALQFSPGNQQGKILLGLIGAAIQDHRLLDTRLERYATGGTPIGFADDRHIITIAGSRAGKGRAVLVPNLITWPGSVLVIDPKGDLASLTARYRSEKLRQAVHVLDPFGTVQNCPHDYNAVFNPLTILADPLSKTRVEDAGLISDALIVPSGAADPHWDEAARNFVEGLVLHVATAPAHKDRRDLITVYELLLKANEQQGGSFVLAEEMGRSTAEEGAIAAAAADFYEKADRERDSVLSSARRQLRFLGYRQMKGVLRGDSIDLASLKKKPTTIYLSLPAMRMGTCSRWLRLFVNLTLAAMEREQARLPYPVLLMLDEFAVLGPMKTIEDAAGQIAGLGVKLWPVLQDLGQLKALYKDRWETFMGNAGLLQFFGNSDLTTLEWMSKRLGTTTAISPSRSAPTYGARAKEGATGESWAHTTHDLMTPAELARFFGRDDELLRQLVIRATWAPVVLQRAYYDKHELFAPYREFVKSTDGR